MAEPVELRWSLIEDVPLPGAVNMARDHALTEALPPGVALLRLYGWSTPTVSFGRNEPVRGRYDVEGMLSAGLDVVRRPTGGRAVLHHRELTYAVALPIRALGGVRRAYARIHRALGRGLASLGVSAGIADGGGEASVRGVDAGPCFGHPAPGELVALGRKLVGSAQVRMGSALLQHGSILIENDQGGLLRWTAGPTDRGGGVSLAELIGGAPSVREVRAAVRVGFAEEFGAPDRGAHWGVETPAGPEAVGRLEEVYRSDSWTWRR